MANETSLKQVVIVIAVIAIGGVAYWLDDVKDEEPSQSQAPAPKPPTDLTRMTMAQAIKHCRALWTAFHYDQAPLAIAWHKGGLDWYVLDGVDTTSMRHFACNAIEVTRGARYERVMSRHVPAPTGEPRNILNDRNLFSYYTDLPDPGLRALEATEHPATRTLLERRWPNSGTVQFNWREPKDFPILFRAHPADLAFDQYPLLKPLPTATNWLKQPDRVFALLEKQLPPQARIAELDIRDNSITVQIFGAIKNFDNKPPANFGDATFDEYGIRDMDWWYPREQVGSSCAPGHSLKEVAALFAEHANAKRTDMYNANFSCRGTGKLSGRGSWTLRVPRRR